MTITFKAKYERKYYVKTQRDEWTPIIPLDEEEAIEAGAIDSDDYQMYTLDDAETMINIKPTSSNEWDLKRCGEAIFKHFDEAVRPYQ